MSIYREKYELIRARLILEMDVLKSVRTRNYDTLSRLLISGEDHRFYYHIGFDLIAIIRAIKNRAIHGNIEGASTIEQQLVRVITKEFDRSVSRKIQEIFLATTINSIVPKSSIPEIYLNVAYYGTDTVGIQSAVGKMGLTDNAEIPLDKAAELVSRIKYPQPTFPTPVRINQIETRKRHLIALYYKHLSYKYFKVYG